MNSGPTTSIELAIAADNKYVRDQLGSSVTLLDDGSPLSDLRKVLTKDAAHGLLDRGLIVLYSGHGLATATTADGRVESQLCSDSPPQSIRDLVDYVAQLNPSPAWAVFVINACESAYVDVSHFNLPTAVISASPQPVTLHNVPTRDATNPEQALAPTPVTKAFVDAWAHPDRTENDINGDGVVSSRELVHAIRVTAFEAERKNRPSFLEPHLQLHATSDLPVRYVANPPSPPPELLQLLAVLDSGTDGDQTVAAALRAQLSRSGLPSVPFDWVAVKTEDNHDVAHCPASTLRTDPHNMQASPTLRCPPQDLTWTILRQFAHFASFMETYELQARGAFWDVIRLRDRRLMSTTRGNTPLDATPRRITQVLERTDGLDVYRVLGRMPTVDACKNTYANYCTALNSREFAVCWEEEGQCFTSKRIAP